jgi:hypothetical protein
MKKKYVVLEHLTLPNRGLRFWSTNTENNTHSAKGELWYKEILFSDSKEECIEECRNINREVLPTFNELVEFHKQQK